MLQELSWAHYFGCTYHSNVTKIHLDAAQIIKYNKGDILVFVGMFCPFYTVHRSQLIWLMLTHKCPVVSKYN